MRGVALNINIYYGGRGIIDDPTNYVINKIQEVLEELRVNVVRYNLYEHKNSITTLPQTLKEVDGIICNSFWMHAGYMEIKKKFPAFTCAPLLCLQPMGKEKPD